ncbi:MAG: hypothetical protein NXH86_07585 [Flavobacteriaceae bacterium]|uniref:hypothetical protein n=1 Tax=Flagellimonas sp. SN16 TaxID=3415142 RepID=UPI003C478D72|nr:hypothetical protein [Flavobacteriaceae bacterium]
MKKGIVIISVLIGFISFGQDVIIENDTLILWTKERPLSWKDFNGKSKTPKNHSGIHTAAETATGPIFIHKMDKNGNMVPYPLNYFYKSLSWTISNDSLLLVHEQLHFDIKELYIRKLRKGYEELVKKNVYENSAYSNLSEKILERCSTVQNEYDKEVRFNKTEQMEWRKQIDKGLEELKEYEYYPE